MRRSMLIGVALLLAPIGVTVLLPLQPARAQSPGPVGQIGVPGPELVIDVRWSGDRRGEFIEIGVLPPAFRGPTPVPFVLPRDTPVPRLTVVPFIQTSTPSLPPPPTRIPFPPPTVLGPLPP